MLAAKYFFITNVINIKMSLNKIYLQFHSEKLPYILFLNYSTLREAYLKSFVFEKEEITFEIVDFYRVVQEAKVARPVGGENSLFVRRSDIKSGIFSRS